MTNGTGFRNRISTEARLRQTKNIGAIVDDLVTMSNEYHRVIRILGCQTIHQYRLGLCVKC